MADLTYLELINTVIGRLDRTDLSDVAREHILERIEHYGKEYFYSSEIVDESITTVGGQRYYNLPIRWANVTFVQVLTGVWVPLTRRMHDYINQNDNLPSPIQSIPSDWALFNGQIRIWPCGPGYKLQLTMNQSPAAPATDGEYTFWSTDAQSLIVSSACEEICKQKINDPIREGKFAEVRKVEERLLASKSIRAMGGVKVKGWL